MKQDIQKISRELSFEENIRDYRLNFQSTWGLFSPKKIDEGSRLLLDKVKVNVSDRILDLGCGFGALGVVLAKIALEGRVDMIDKDFVAVRYANKNIKLNHIVNAEAYLSNLFDQIEENKKFDLIVSNLPAKVSKEMFWIMFDDMKRYLDKDGRVYLVIIRGLKKFIKRSLKENFGNCKRVAYNKNYILYMAKKE